MSSSDNVIFSTDFTDADLPDKLKWFAGPRKYQTKVSNGRGLKIVHDEKTDFWQKTYYTPTLVADNGHFLYLPINQEKIVVETCFETSNGPGQFDQAGLMVRADKDHWIKTGLEYCDGAYQLSVVVTNVYSDWSVQAWPSGKLTIRMYKLGDNFVIERKKHDSDEWNFIRIAHLDLSSSGNQIDMGVFACSPQDAGGETYFDYVNFKNTTGFHHSN